MTVHLWTETRTFKTRNHQISENFWFQRQIWTNSFGFFCQTWWEVGSNFLAWSPKICAKCQSFSWKKRVQKEEGGIHQWPMQHQTYVKRQTCVQACEECPLSIRTRHNVSFISVFIYTTWWNLLLCGTKQGIPIFTHVYMGWCHDLSLVYM